MSDRIDDCIHGRSLAVYCQLCEVMSPAPAPAGTPTDDTAESLLGMAVQQIERLRAHAAERYPDVHRYREGDYELGTYIVGLLHWSDRAKAALGHGTAASEREEKMK